MVRGIFAALVALIAAAPAAMAQSQTVIFWQPGFPAADTSAPRMEPLQQAFPGAQFADAAHLDDALASAQTHLLVMPYGSAYPADAWKNILAYLDRGGNLIVLGGRPFTRAADLAGNAWTLRGYDVAHSQELRIDDYQETPGSAGLQFAANPDVAPALPAFPWKRAFSPVIRLSEKGEFPSEAGTTGNEDSWLTALAWGEQDGLKLAAPVVLIDHVAARFAPGRWIFLNCDADPAALENATLLAALQELALRSNDRFTFRPKFAVFAPGEPIEFQFQPARSHDADPGDELAIEVTPETGSPQSFHFPADPAKLITFPAGVADGGRFHTVQATLLRNHVPIWTYRSGFWMRDLDYLRSGSRLSVNADYFQLDGKPLPVVGTTYMAGDVDRAYLWEPNPFVWDRDMKLIRDAGIDMLRSGIWSGWPRITNPDHSVTEQALRSIEAFLMTARRYNLPVQFNLFAFIPDLTGRGHPYLSQQDEQQRYVSSILGRFHEVPFLAWDLINEPSPNRNLWRTAPEMDELSSFTGWAARNRPEERRFPLPSMASISQDQVPRQAYDYQLFTQDFFRKWIERQQATLHAAGSQQLITVGQDEGGVAGRLSPAFFSPDVGFTTTHWWWDFDSILWAGLMAKMPGEPMLAQEIGEQRRLTQDGRLRLSADEESWQLERKLSISFAQGAGGIEWVWNVNSMMANPAEVTIGAVRPDETEKPEARVLAGVAQFARQHPASFTRIEPPPVTIVVSQAQLYGGQWGLAVDTQKKSVRALAYYDRQPARMLPENRLAELGQPKLVILPAAQAITDDGWIKLLEYVSAGGCLLVTGPLQYNEYSERVDHLTPLGLRATIEPILVRESHLQLPGSAASISVSYPSAIQTAPLDTMRFVDGASVDTIHHGSGTILWAADPVEFAEGCDAPAALYRYALQQAGVAPSFTALHPLSPGVLAFPTLLDDAVLYSFSNESLDDQPVDLRDAATKTRLHFMLAAQRGALVLLDRKTGAVLASYGARLE